MGISINRLHEQLVKDTIRSRLSDGDAMLLFFLLHTYEIELLPDVLGDNCDGAIVAAVTQRHAAEIIAVLYRDRAKKRDDHRASYEHWYWKWNTDWGSYGREERFTAEDRRRLEELQSQLEAHPWVLELREEE
jgi:hypothetical protein